MWHVGTLKKYERGAEILTN